MQVTKSKIQHLYTLIFTLVGVLVWVLMCGDVATAGSYIDSAHGSTSYGVNRSGTGYAKGDCVNCHDSCDNEFMLFAPMNQDSQTDNFCFQCHKGDGSVQVGGVTNTTYSTTFGGGTATFTNIYDAFNPPSGDTRSSHNLSDVLNHAIKRGLGFTVDSNACIVCHDPHHSQKNFPVSINSIGGVNTALRIPAHYDDKPVNLWGDETSAISGQNELMNEFVGNKVYQAPYCVGKTTYEPAGDSIQDGSNLPNFVTGCRSNCHARANVYSTERGRNLTPVNFTTSTSELGNRSVHGKFANDTGGMGYTIAPYTADETTNYVLSCTDCHEPHGSPNEFLLRTSVNGKDNISVPEPGEWWEFCTACHVLTNGTDMYHKPPPRAAPICPTCHVHDAPGWEGYF